MDNRHIRGAQLITANQLTGRVNPWWPIGWGLKLGNIGLPRRLETEHCLILGSQGSGKSSLLRSILQQIEQRGQPAIVVDPECEFLAEFYQPERGDYILNPLDERGPFWSPWLEFRDEQRAMDIQAMVASLIRNRARTQAEGYWQTEARRLLERLFHQTTNLATLRNLAARDKGDGREGVINALQPLSLLPGREQCGNEWSALQWALQRKGWLFLTSTEDSRPSVLALQGIWLDLLIRRLMSGEIGGQQTFIVADEVATMGYQPQLEQSLITRGRKRGIAVILSLQNIAQLRGIYGHDPTITLTAQPGTTVLLKCGEPETAEWASRLIGEHEVEGKRYPERLVMASEIQTLEKFRGYIICGPYRAPVRIKRRYLQKHYEPFIFRQMEQPVTVMESEVPKWFRKRFGYIDERCNKVKTISYKGYGAKGVKLLFPDAEAMWKELGPPPDDGEDWSVDRKACGAPNCHPECGKHYEPKHVGWATKAQQTANRALQGSASLFAQDKSANMPPPTNPTPPK